MHTCRCNSSQVTIEVCVPPGQQSPNTAFQSRPFAKCGDMTLVKGNLNFANVQSQPQVNGRGVFMYIIDFIDVYMYENVYNIIYINI
jgi:hypothetical protein